MGEAVIACIKLTMATQVAQARGVTLRDAADRVEKVFNRHLSDAPTVASMIAMIEEAVAL